jgi:hypothetical protein
VTAPGLLFSQKGFSKILHGFLIHPKNKIWGKTIWGIPKKKKKRDKNRLNAQKNFCWCQGGAERRVKRAQTREQGPPSAPAEILSIIIINFGTTYYLKE